jgi:hypothetical protein
MLILPSSSSSTGQLMLMLMVVALDIGIVYNCTRTYVRIYLHQERKFVDVDIGLAACCMQLLRDTYTNYMGDYSPVRSIKRLRLLML